MALEMSGLALRFGTLSVLEGVDVEVQEGEFISIVGPSGVGKSTLLSVLVGLRDPDCGEVRLDGRPTTAAERLGRIGFMAQRDLLLPHLTVAANVALPLVLHGAPPRQAQLEVAALLEEFGLARHARVYPGALSGGMRQRAALLRTLLAGQEIVALDEPLGALDAITRSRLWLWLQARLRDHRRTCVLVTHDLDEALFLSDRVVVLSGQPASVSEVFAVPLAHPRSLDDLADLAPIKTRLLRRLAEDGV